MIFVIKSNTFKLLKYSYGTIAVDILKNYGVLFHLQLLQHILRNQFNIPYNYLILFNNFYYRFNRQ